VSGEGEQAAIISAVARQVVKVRLGQGMGRQVSAARAPHQAVEKRR